MAKENGTAPASEAGKPNGKKTREARKRVMTFVYQDAADGKVKLGKHKTNTFSVDKAWEEYVAKQGLVGATRIETAIHGFVEWMPNKLRSLTRDELEKIAIANHLL
jgi:hypothetical protein